MKVVVELCNPEDEEEEEEELVSSSQLNPAATLQLLFKRDQGFGVSVQAGRRGRKRSSSQLNPVADSGYFTDVPKVLHMCLRFKVTNVP